jgi:hypothetical protein
MFCDITWHIMLHCIHWSVGANSSEDLVLCLYGSPTIFGLKTVSAGTVTIQLDATCMKFIQRPLSPHVSGINMPIVRRTV